MSLNSFLIHGHEVHLYTYGSVEGVPAGVTIKDAEEILPSSRIFQYQSEGFGKGSLSGFGNVFRYKLLYERGGWWTDCDVVCRRYFDFEDDTVIASAWEPKVPKNRGVINCVLKMPVGSPLMESCVHKVDSVDVANAPFASMGPVLLDQEVAAHGLYDKVVDWRVFCPIGYRDTRKLVESPSMRSVVRWGWRSLKRLPHVRVWRNTYGVHLWSNVWREADMDKDGDFPNSSLYEQLKETYLP